MRPPRLLALAALLAAAPPAAALAEEAGSWVGEVELAAGTLEIVVHLEERDEGLAGTLDVPGLDLTGVALGDFESDGREIAFTAAGLGNGVRFRATLDSEGATLSGESAEGPPAAAPATDVFLFDFGGLDEWKPTTPVHVTDRDGYDNQPHFLPDGSGLLYTSIRDGQADIYLYDLETGASSQLTETPESEYSPTPVPGSAFFSTVRVEADGTQRLWRFPLAGGEPQRVLEDVEPVGYHVWLSEYTLALFVLGDPPTLELVYLGDPAPPQRLTDNIGRSLHRVPESGHLSFVRKFSPERWYIDAYDPWIDRALKVVETRPGSEDFVWTADGRILMGEGSKLYAYRPGPRAEIDPWVEVADLEVFGVDGITRLAISPDQSHLAVVGEREVPPPPTPEARPFTLERR